MLEIHLHGWYAIGSLSKMLSCSPAIIGTGHFAGLIIPQVGDASFKTYHRAPATKRSALHVGAGGGLRVRFGGQSERASGAIERFVGAQSRAVLNCELLNSFHVDQSRVG